MNRASYLQSSELNPTCQTVVQQIFPVQLSVRKSVTYRDKQSEEAKSPTLINRTTRRHDDPHDNVLIGVINLGTHFKEYTRGMTEVGVGVGVTH